MNDMKIVLASNNKNKIRELQAILSEKLGEVEIMSLSDIGFEGDIIEDGETFEENAMIKARAVSALGYIGVGDDSGLSVDALGGAPGIYSARYAGRHGDDMANNEKLLFELSGKHDRGAAFVCYIACSFPAETGLCDFTVRGEARGEITLKEYGAGGFGYDPLFYVPELSKTFAEMTESEKNSISHRGCALGKFADRIKEIIGDINADK